jgi:hypothetical protein
MIPPGAADCASEGEGEGEAEEPILFCQESCAADSDCTAGTSCDEEQGVCGVVPPPPCETDQQCNLSSSCLSDAGCTGQVCVDVGLADEGRCAIEQGVVTCEDVGQVDFATTKFADGRGAVNACVGTFLTCNDASGACELAPTCDADTDCTTNPGGDACIDGACGCVADADCGDAGAIGSFCRVDINVCGCADDTECTDAPEAPVCRAGRCGCGDDADCAAAAIGGVCTDIGFCGCGVDDDCNTADQACSEEADADVD